LKLSRQRFLAIDALKVISFQLSAPGRPRSTAGVTCSS